MYKCENCGYVSATKLGKCPECQGFGTMKEDFSTNTKQTGFKRKSIKGKELVSDNKQKLDINFFEIENTELKRIFKRGIKVSGTYLIGGEPGIGKSTILLQIIGEIIKNNDIKIGYFSGEENIDQINDRNKRLNIDTKGCLDIYHSTQLEDILTTCEVKGYNLIVIDSIQTIYSNIVDSTAGSPNQVKYCSEKISEFCKANGMTGIIVGHVTKGGEIAGPKYLEHIVDVVLYLEGDRFGQYRFLRSKKNRFDNTDDVAIFEMTLFGLQPVHDLKDRIINQANISIPGNVLTVGLDSARPVLANVEVLINKTKLKYPQRTAVGIDSNRLNLILAVLERYLKLSLGFFDIYVNIPGEFKFYDSGLDLAIAFAIFSQYKNNIVNKNYIFIGEIGLGGQILKTKLHEKRKNEIPEGFEIIDYTKIKNIIEINNFL